MAPSSRILRAQALPLLLLILGMGFAVIPLAAGRVFFYWDNAQQQYAQTAFLHEALHSGSIPQWWSAIGAGFPVVAEGQAAHFDPIRMAFAWLFPTPAAFMLEIGFYLAIAGISTYLFLRQFRLQREACFAGALCQMFGSYSIVFIRNVALHRAFAFLPLAFLAAERFARGGQPVAALWVAAIIGLQLTSGHPTFVIITAVTTTFYVAFRTIQRARSEGWRTGSLMAALTRRLAAWAACVVLGFGLGGVQVLPTLLHVDDSIRAGGLSFDYATNRLTAHIRGLGALLFPYIYQQGDTVPGATGGDYFNTVPNGQIYIGALALLLALLAFAPRRRERPVWPLTLLGVLAFLFAMGGRTPLFPALWSLPGLDGFRYPSRFMLVGGFCLAGLAAIGYQRLLARSRTGKPGRAETAILVLFGAGGLLAAATALTFRDRLARLVRVAPDANAGILISVLLIAGAVAVAVAILATRGRVRAVRVLALSMVLFDLMLFRTRSGYAPSVPLASFASPPPMALAMEGDGQRFRVMSLVSVEDGLNRPEDLIEFLQANATALWGLESTGAYFSLMLKRYYALHESLIKELAHSPAAGDGLAGYLGALNVRYVVGRRDQGPRNWPRVHETDRAVLWRNPAFLPRVRLVGSVVAERIELRDEWNERARASRLVRYHAMVRDWSTRLEDAQIVDNIMEQGIDFATTAVVAGEEMPRVTGHDPAASVRVVEERDGDETYEVLSGERELLVVSNTHYPGWSATVNGTPAPIYRVNYVGMGIALPPGRSVVRLHFQTPGLWPGLAVTAGSIVLWLISLAVASRKARGKRASRSLGEDTMKGHRSQRAVLAVVAGCCCWPIGLAGQGFRQTQTDDYTRYELQAPGSASFRIRYDVSATTAGAGFYLNTIRQGAEEEVHGVRDLMTGAVLEWRIVSGEEARAIGMQNASAGARYIAVSLARPVPPGGQARIRIDKTYRDSASYRHSGDRISFERSLGIDRNAVVLPPGFELTACNVPSQVAREADGRIRISFMNGGPSAMPLRIEARRLGREPAGGLAGASAGASAAATTTVQQPAGARVGYRVTERAFEDRDITYHLDQPETHSFRLFHDYTETRPGTDRYVNVVRPGSRAANPEAMILDTGERLEVATLRGEEIARQGIDIGGAVTPESEVVLIRFDPVPEGGSVRLRIEETYTDPGRYVLDGDELVWDRALGRPRNTVVLPAGWYLTASSIPAVVTETEDGRIRLRFINDRPGEIQVLVRGARR